MKQTQQLNNKSKRLSNALKSELNEVNLHIETCKQSHNNFWVELTIPMDHLDNETKGKHIVSRSLGNWGC